MGAQNLPPDKDQELSRAIHEVLGPRMAMMLHVVAAAERRSTPMPYSEAVLYWLKENMPRTADKVLRRLENKS